MSPHSADVRMKPEQAVSYFPRGLHQPQGSFRFSADALLLACLFPSGSGETLLDIGSGCGVVALGALLRRVCTKAVGIDLSSVLVQAANTNARQLGLTSRFVCFQCDAGGSVASRRIIDELSILAGGAGAAHPGGSWAGFDSVVANPPFYTPGSGRLPANALRQQALFAQEHTLDDFCQLAASTLKPEGRFGLIYPAEGMTRLTKALAESGFTLCRRLPVIFRQGKAPARYLVEASKEPSPLSLAPEAPLVLHNAAGSLTTEAVEFCPYLLAGRKEAPLGSKTP